MHFLENVYYWASDGCPDAKPAGVIAVDLGQNEADFHDEEIRAIRNCCCEYGLLDDTGLQLGFTSDDMDLICRNEGDANFLTAGQIVADWQWAAIKETPGLRYAEHSLVATVEEIEAFFDNPDNQEPE